MCTVHTKCTLCTLYTNCIHILHQHNSCLRENGAVAPFCARAKCRSRLWSANYKNLRSKFCKEHKFCKLQNLRSANLQTANLQIPNFACKIWNMSQIFANCKICNCNFAKRKITVFKFCEAKFGICCIFVTFSTFATCKLQTWNFCTPPCGAPFPAFFCTKCAKCSALYRKREKSGMGTFAKQKCPQNAL